MLGVPLDHKLGESIVTISVIIRQSVIIPGVSCGEQMQNLLDLTSQQIWEMFLWMSLFLKA